MRYFIYCGCGGKSVQRKFRRQGCGELLLLFAHYKIIQVWILKFLLSIINILQLGIESRVVFCVKFCEKVFLNCGVPWWEKSSCCLTPDSLQHQTWCQLPELLVRYLSELSAVDPNTSRVMTHVIPRLALKNKSCSQADGWVKRMKVVAQNGIVTGSLAAPCRSASGQ